MLSISQELKNSVIFEVNSVAGLAHSQHVFPIFHEFPDDTSHVEEQVALAGVEERSGEQGGGGGGGGQAKSPETRSASLSRERV